MFSIEDFYKEYETETTEVVINNKKFSLLLPRYLYPFINPIDLFHDFPLWAKIWKASWVLSGYLAGMPVDDDKRILEIGGGIGLVSIVAAAFGHQITMTEYNPDALNFARANAHRNNWIGIIQGCQNNLTRLWPPKLPTKRKIFPPSFGYSDRI